MAKFPNIVSNCLNRGPKRFEYLDRWLNTKDQTPLKAILDSELSKLLKRNIDTPE